MNDNQSWLPIVQTQNSMMTALGGQHAEIMTMLNHVVASLQTPENTYDQYILQPYGQTFDSRGYKYNGIISEYFMNLYISLNGVSWRVKCMPGYNQTNIPNGASVNSDSNLSVILVRSNFLQADENKSVNHEYLTPNLLITIPYTHFTATGAYYNFDFNNSLNRNATVRTLHVLNTMDQALQACYAGGYDTAVQYASDAPGGNVSYTYNFGACPAGFDAIWTVGVGVQTATANPGLGQAVNSVQFQLESPATLPTKGEVQIYITEIL